MRIEYVIKRCGEARSFETASLARSLERALLYDERGSLLAPGKVGLDSAEQASVNAIVANVLAVLSGDGRGHVHVRTVQTALFRALLAAGEVDAAWRMAAFWQRRDAEDALADSIRWFDPRAVNSAPAIVALDRAASPRDGIVTVPIDAHVDETLVVSTPHQ